MTVLRKVLFTIITLLSLTSVVAQTHRGKASYYSKRATGARTANGERVHHDSMTCAHRTLPFGTLLRVKNLRNGKEVIVRVTDRGPHSRGRIIDLSYGAARELGMLSQGIALVEIEKIDNIRPPFKIDGPEINLPEFEFQTSPSEYVKPRLTKKGNDKKKNHKKYTDNNRKRE